MLAHLRIGQRQLAQLVVRRCRPAPSAARAPCRSPAPARRSRRPRATASSNAGQPAATTPPAWPSMLPQLLGHVRRERRQHQHQRLDRFLQHRDRCRPLDRADRVAARRPRGPIARQPRARRRSAYSSLTSSISAGDRRVQVHARIEIERHAPDRLVRLAPQRALGVVQLELAGRRECPRRRSSRTADRRAARRARGSGSCPRARRRSTRFPSPAARRTSRRAAARRRRTSRSCRRDRRRCPSTST